MKNHFYFSYFGNKRNEVNQIYQNINFDNTNLIIEPFCGSCAMSYFISEQQPQKFKYILNDNDQHLINFMKIIKNKRKTKSFENKINKLLFDKQNKFIDKETYVKIVKNNDIYGWFISKKYFNIKPGLYPMGRPSKKLNLEEYPMTNFLRNENIIFSNEDGSDFIEKYKNDKDVLLLIDPPYLLSNNSFYTNPSINIYEQIYRNKSKKECKILFCLEYNWIIDLIFNSWNIIQYNKIYQTTKRETIHAIIKNF